MNYTEQLKEISTNALLHLYFYKLQQKPRFVPAKTANTVLVKYLKSKMTQTQYSEIKKEIKLLCLIGKKQSELLEKRIEKLNQVPSVTEGESELDNFILLVRDVEKKFGQNIDVMPVSEIEQIPNVDTKMVCLDSKGIGKHFCPDSQKLVTPISLYYHCSTSLRLKLQEAIDSSPFTITDESKMQNELTRLMIGPAQTDNPEGPHVG